MKRLIKRVKEIPDSYDDFVLGVINYAKQQPEHVSLLHRLLDENTNISSSDIIEFIYNQPDFRSKEWKKGDK